MADEYQVFDDKGKSLSGAKPVDRETAHRIYTEEREKTRGRPGEKPSLIRKDQEKLGPGETE